MREACFALACALWVAPAHAQDASSAPARCAALSTEGIEVVAYEVQPGDSCTRIARARFGDRDRYDIIHAYNPDMGPPPHRLQAGTILCLPRTAPPRDAIPTARITALRQEVRSRPDARAEWARAALGAGLTRGERVNVLTRAFAELTFRNTSVVTLRGDTLVVIYGQGDVRTAAPRATLEEGALRTRLGELRTGNRLAIDTPSAEIVLAGGSAVTSVDGASTARVSNHEGRPAQVRSRAGGSVRVDPGMGSSVPRGARPTPPQPLPPAPAWVSAPPRHVGVAQLTTVRGEWSPVPNARVYRVEIARHPDGRGLVAAVEVPSDVHRFEIHRLPPGVYYTRVSTIDGDFFESAPSDAYRFELVLAQLEVPGQRVPAPFDFGDASAEPQPLAVLPGARFVAPEGVRCALGEGSTEGPFTLHAPGPAALQCQDAEGNALGVVEVEVAPVSLRAPGTDAGSVVFERGGEAEVAIEVDSALALPADARVVGSEGLEVIGYELADDVLSIRVRVADQAPASGSLSLVVGEAATPLGAMAVSVRDAPAPAPVAEAPAPEPAPAVAPLPQTFGVVPWPSLVGVRDIGRAGLSVGITGDVGGDGAHTRGRGSAHAQAGLFDRRLQLALATAVDFHDRWTHPSQRGAGDLYAAAAYTPRWGPLTLGFELAAFLPTGASQGGLSVVRLVPSAHAQLALEPTLWLRARLGAFADVDDSGNAAFVSAYALDWQPVGPLTLGAELALSLGQEQRDLLFIPTAGLRAGLLAGPLLFTAGARFGLSESAWRTTGAWSVVFGAEWTGILASL